MSPMVSFRGWAKYWKGVVGRGADGWSDFHVVGGGFRLVGFDGAFCGVLVSRKSLPCRRRSHSVGHTRFLIDADQARFYSIGYTIGRNSAIDGGGNR